MSIPVIPALPELNTSANIALSQWNENDRNVQKQMTESLFDSIRTGGVGSNLKTYVDDSVNALYLNGKIYVGGKTAIYIGSKKIDLPYIEQSNLFFTTFYVPTQTSSEKNYIVGSIVSLKLTEQTDEFIGTDGTSIPEYTYDPEFEVEDGYVDISTDFASDFSSVTVKTENDSTGVLFKKIVVMKDESTDTNINENLNVYINKNSNEATGFQLFIPLFVVLHFKTGVNFSPCKQFNPKRINSSCLSVFWSVPEYKTDVLASNNGINQVENQTNKEFKGDIKIENLIVNNKIITKEKKYQRFDDFINESDTTHADYVDFILYSENNKIDPKLFPFYWTSSGSMESNMSFIPKIKYISGFDYEELFVLYIDGKYYYPQRVSETELVFVENFYPIPNNGLQTYAQENKVATLTFDTEYFNNASSVPLTEVEIYREVRLLNSSTENIGLCIPKEWHLKVESIFVKVENYIVKNDIRLYYLDSKLENNLNKNEKIAPSGIIGDATVSGTMNFLIPPIGTSCLLDDIPSGSIVSPDYFLVTNSIPIGIRWLLRDSNGYVYIPKNIKDNYDLKCVYFYKKTVSGVDIDCSVCGSLTIDSSSSNILSNNIYIENNESDLVLAYKIKIPNTMSTISSVLIIPEYKTTPYFSVDYS